MRVISDSNLRISHSEIDIAKPRLNAAPHLEIESKNRDEDAVSNARNNTSSNLTSQNNISYDSKDDIVQTCISKVDYPVSEKEKIKVILGLNNS